jgi:S-DNA-T family DNA segregation ATPase FtsK/SpoIIIE
MAEPRKVRWDMMALAMGAFSLFIWVSLFSHDSADAVGELAWPFGAIYSPDMVTFPVNETLQNACGYWGALASHLLLHAVGVGAYLIAILITLSVLVMLRQRPLASPLGRSIGWTLVLASLTTLPVLLHWHPNIPVAVGSGGYLGAAIGIWIDRHFAFAGGLILVLSGLIAGLLLSTEYAVLKFFKILAVGPTTSVLKHRSLKRAQKANLVSEHTAGEDLDESDSLDEFDDDDELRVRIRKKDRLATVEDEEPFDDDMDELTELKGRPAVAISAAALAGKALGGVVGGAVGGLKKSFLSGFSSAARKPARTSDIENVEDAPLDQPALPTGTLAESRKLKIAGRRVSARADKPHLAEPAAIAPTNSEIVVQGSDSSPKTPRSKLRVKNGADKKAEADSLAFLDDTRLPEGTEEYVLPGIDLLEEATDIDYEAQALEVRRKAKVLEQTFQHFRFNVKVVEIETGPVIAQYEIKLEEGLRLSKITGLADDLAIALRVPSVRIVAPIPGKNTVGIEVPNETRQVVRMREVIEESGALTKKMKIPLFIGKDVSGNALAVDLAALPHLLIAGRTGTGKSVCLNSIISSILMTRRPDEVRLLMIDPKMVELSGYGRLPHLMHPVVTDMRKAEAILAWAVDKMEERYQLLARVGVRHITSYNQLGREELHDRLQAETQEEADAFPDYLPFIVIVADEIADMMMTAGKEVEQHIIRLAQKSRAVGIHLILATQKPTVDVITGLIKSNLPARISFQVASRTDSRVVLDEMGADKLLGNGDMLFLGAGSSGLMRGQGTYLGDDEINRVVDHCSTGEQNFVNELVNLEVKDESGDTPAKPGMLKERDDMYEAAIDVVVAEGRGSCSLLQRAIGVGYGRAARMIDWMAEDGIVGEYNGPKAREVIISQNDWNVMKNGGDPSATPEPIANRSNKIRLEEATVGPENEAWDEEEEEENDEEFEIDETVDEESSADLEDDDSDDEDQDDEEFADEEIEDEEIEDETLEDGELEDGDFVEEDDSEEDELVDVDDGHFEEVEDDDYEEVDEP